MAVMTKSKMTTARGLQRQNREARQETDALDNCIQPTSTQLLMNYLCNELHLHSIFISPNTDRSDRSAQQLAGFGDSPKERHTHQTKLWSSDRIQ